MANSKYLDICLFYRSNLFISALTDINKIIKTHSSVSAAKKPKEDARHTSVLFTGTVKLPNSAFCISKTAKPISTKFTYFLPYIYTTLHTKIEGNSFSSS